MQPSPSFAVVSPLTSRVERSILAIVLPELLEELALECQPRGASGARNVPRAIVLAEERSTGLEPTAHLDAVNAAARRLGVSPRQTIAQATAIVENLVLHAVPPARVTQALQQVAEAALGFGSPVSFLAPDTVWVDVAGTSHLFGGIRPLALMLSAHIRALGHAARVAVASGPWLARAFAQHADFDETGVFLAEATREAQQVGLLPIAALPIPSETVAWFSRLGLLSLDDLRRLPRSALAARLGNDADRMLELIHARDDSVLDAYHPEELPLEQQSWDTPLENVEPLLFVLKGLCSRLASRLEGRGQAARELLLSIQYDKSIVALRHREHEAGNARLGRSPGAASEHARPSAPAGSGARAQRGAVFDDRGVPSAARSSLGQSQVQPVRSGAAAFLPNERVAASSERCAVGTAPVALGPILVEELRLRLGSPLVHADDLERITRARLQRETLRAPANGLCLQVTSITEARHWQLGLNADVGLGQLTADPSLITVLMNELGADVGDAAVGLLELEDSHLLEKSSGFISLQRLQTLPQGAGLARGIGGSHARSNERASGNGIQRPRAGLSAHVPTRLIAPIEIEAPLEKNELVVLQQRAFVIESVVFEERLESVEWWAPQPVSRDYFRLWLAALSAGHAVPALPRRGRDGLEVLVYVNRDDGKKYVQAIYD